jgi:DtxR family Mn-dependent transcriptional regulator
VTAALKRMAGSGYLRVARDGHIQLTAKGKAIAQHLVLRHRLAEKLLTDVIGLEWSRAHEEAERLEHGISAEVASLLLKRFGRNSRCPHGVPILGGMTKLRRETNAQRLSEAEVGHSYEVLRVYEKDPKFLEFINERSLRPSARLRLHKREYDETLAVSVGRPSSARIHLGKPATERIWVRRVPS